MTDCGSNENPNNEDEGKGEIHQLTAALIHEGLQFATRMEQHFLTHDPDVERALKFQRDLQICTARYQETYKQLAKQKTQQRITDYLIIRNSTTQDDNNKQKSSLDSNTLDVLDISSDESNFCPVGHKRARLLSSSDE